MRCEELAYRRGHIWAESEMLLDVPVMGFILFSLAYSFEASCHSLVRDLGGGLATPSSVDMIVRGLREDEEDNVSKYENTSQNVLVETV